LEEAVVRLEVIAAKEARRISSPFLLFFLVLPFSNDSILFLRTSSADLRRSVMDSGPSNFRAEDQNSGPALMWSSLRARRELQRITARITMIDPKEIERIAGPVRRSGGDRGGGWDTEESAHAQSHFWL
jgi:hypothetical protein